MSKYSLEHFLEACGATGPLRLAVEHANGADRYLLHQPFAVLGRDPRADVRLMDAGASRRHLYLQVIRGRLLCLDLTTSSPDGRKQPLHRWLSAGTEVRLPSSTVRLTDAPGTALLPAELPHVRLVITGGGTEKAELRIRHPLVLIGQAQECQIRLRDERVSRFHCALVHTPTGVWVVDLLGRGGVTLNGVLVRSARFDEGDELGVSGAYTFRLQPTMTGEQRPPEDTALAVSGVFLVPPSPEPALPAVSAQADEPRPLLPAERPDTTSISETSLALAFGRMQQQMAEQFHMTMTRVVGAFREIHRDQMKMLFQEFARVQQLTDELAAIKDQLRELRNAPAARPRESASLPPPEIAAPVRPSDSSGKAGDVKVPPLKARPPERTGASTSSPAEVHAWLSGRVDAIQKERDGRWQKIFSLLSGSSPPAR